MDFYKYRVLFFEVVLRLKDYLEFYCEKSFGPPLDSDCESHVADGLLTTNICMIFNNSHRDELTHPLYLIKHVPIVCTVQN